MIATEPPPPTAWGGPLARSLLPEVRQALAGAPDRRLRLLPPLPPRARRAARLLLQEAARIGDGHVLEAGSGELLLLGCEPAPEERLGAALAALGLPEGERWAAEAAAPVLDWAAMAVLAPRHDPQGATVLDQDAAALPLEAALLRRAVLRLGPGVEPCRLAQRLVVSRRRLAAALGPAGAEAELLEEAACRLEARLGAAPAAGDAAAPLMLRPHGPAPAPGGIAVLPLSAAADPPRLLARQEALRRDGWAEIALDGLEAVLLPLLDPAALPPEATLLLRWSPALAGRAGMAALRGRFDPARLVLTACDGTEALGWGLEAGIRRFAGPAVEVLVAAARSREA